VIHDLTRGRAPRWLHEGLAQALEGAPVDPLLRVPGRPTLTGLEALLADGDAARARTAYEVALWVVHDLLDRGGIPAMRELIARPSPEAIRLMGDKAQARVIAKQAGVPVVPGSELALKDESEAGDVAEAAGFPVIFKAAAGGGGRGMRVVRGRAEVAQTFAACQ